MAFSELKELRSQGTNAIRYMQAKGYKIRALNIVYFEGLDADDLKTLNADRIDYWNDARTVIGNDGRVYLSSAATTEPGWYYRLNRLNTNGAAQVAFGQYLNAWRIGKHKDQDALVQCGDLNIYRDGNEDGRRTGDPEFCGSEYGINQHTTSNAPDLVGRWSAGCLVGKYPATHKLFMKICRSMGLETFDTTLIDGSDFVRFP